MVDGGGRYDDGIEIYAAAGFQVSWGFDGVKLQYSGQIKKAQLQQRTYSYFDYTSIAV